MARVSRKNLPAPHTDKELEAYSLWLIGVPIKEIAVIQGVTPKCVGERRDRVRSQAAKCVDINQYRNPIHQLFPLWLKSAKGLLQGGDSAFTNAMGKGLGYFSDKVELALSDNTMSDEDLDRKIAGLITKRKDIVGNPEIEISAKKPITSENDENGD
jgi:hypothetical protein